MLRFLLILACAATIAGCDTFGAYKVRVKSPTARQDVREAPYYDYNKKETVYPR
jgi:hypothetical protein